MSLSMMITHRMLKITSFLQNSPQGISSGCRGHTYHLLTRILTQIRF